jgi:hypothetical protein
MRAQVCHYLLLASRARQVGVSHLECAKLRAGGRSKVSHASPAAPSLCDL